MATESLIVELDARTQKLDAKLKATERKLNDLGDSTEKTDTKLNTMSASAATVGKALGVATIAASALTAGTVALVKQTAAYAKEIKIASQLSGIAVDELQSMAFATSTVGIGIEKLGDISKDTREKIGDFLNTGGGGFQDFVDAMKLTKEEAALVAEEFSHMAGPDILQEMVNRMQDADVSAVQMSHALEGMASDTTNLIPLLLDGGKSMESLRQSMDGVTVPLTEDDFQKLADLDIALQTAGEAASSLANQTLVDLSDWFINAANAASFFFASLNEGSRADLQTKLLPILEEIQEVEEKLSTAGGAEQTRLQRRLDNLAAEREEIVKDLAALDAKREAPELQKTTLDGNSSGGGSGSSSAITSADKREAEIQAIADRFKTEEQLLQEKLDRELEIVGENDELRLQLKEQFILDAMEIDQRYADEKLAIEERVAREAEKQKNKLEREKEKQKRLDDKDAKKQEKQDGELANNAISLANMVFEDSKLVSAGIAFVNTAEGVTKALAKNDWAGAALVAATGAAQISAITSAQKGGSGSASAPTQPTQSDFTRQEETAGLDFSNSSASGSESGAIRFATDSGDDLIDAIAMALNKGQAEGRFS